MSQRGIRKETRLNFEDALTKLPTLLKDEGFGILTEIDVRDTLREKLDVEFRRYRILGACHPPFAHAALLTDLEVGLAMPCNVVVYEDDRGRAVVMAVDPLTVIAGDERLTDIATELRARLSRVLERLV